MRGMHLEGVGPLHGAANKLLYKLMSTESVKQSNHLIVYRPLLHSVFPESGFFPVSQFFTAGGQSIGVSASTSVLPMNIQG